MIGRDSVLGSYGDSMVSKDVFAVISIEDWMSIKNQVI
jgi:hypothetical protein